VGTEHGFERVFRGHTAKDVAGTDKENGWHHVPQLAEHKFNDESRVSQAFAETEGDARLDSFRALFDLGFLAIALTRLGIAYPPHDVFDTLDMACRLYPAWHRHSLENVAARLKIANGAGHRALSDARMLKDVFLAMLRRTPTVKAIADLMRVSQLLRFADAPVCTIEPPAGFEALSTAITERCAMQRRLVA
jgi:DNA polymerase III epsilon subunit-like protein